MTATHDQIVFEANRRARERGPGAPPFLHFIIDVVREGWTPPPPVDPDVVATRVVLADRCDPADDDARQTYVSGVNDGKPHFQTALAGYKAGREAEAERAKVLLEALDDLRQHGTHFDSRKASAALEAYKAGKEAAQ